MVIKNDFINLMTAERLQINSFIELQKIFLKSILTLLKIYLILSH